MNKRAIGRAVRENQVRKGHGKETWNQLKKQTEIICQFQGRQMQRQRQLNALKWKYPRSVCNGIQINDKTLIFQS